MALWIEWPCLWLAGLPAASCYDWGVLFCFVGGGGNFPLWDEASALDCTISDRKTWGLRFTVCSSHWNPKMFLWFFGGSFFCLVKPIDLVQDLLILVITEYYSLAQSCFAPMLLRCCSEKEAVVSIKIPRIMKVSACFPSCFLNISAFWRL